MNRLAQTATNWFSHVAGSQPDAQVPVEEIEDDDGLNASNYISPHHSERRLQRRQRSGQESSPLSNGREPGMQRTNAAARSEEMNRLMKPRAGDVGASGTPLRLPSDARPVPRNTQHYGGPRPRNDFTSGSIGANTGKKATGLTGRNVEAGHVSKRRKLADANAAGDGFERSRFFDETRRGDSIRTRHGTREENSRPLDAKVIIERQREFVEDSLGEDDFDVELSTQNTKKRRKGDQDSDVDSGAEPAKLRRKQRRSALINGQHGSGRSSPDPLTADSDPIGFYDTVHHVGNTQRSHQQSQTPARVGGFKLKRFRHPNLDTNEHGIQLVPKNNVLSSRNGSTTYAVEINGLDSKFKLRTKEIVQCYHHKDNHLVVLKLRQTATASTELYVAMWFAEMRDRIAFFREIEGALTEKLTQWSVAKLERLALGDLKIIAVEPEAEAAAQDERSFDNKHQKKLIHKFQNSPGKTQYKPGSIDKTIKNARLDQDQAATGTRRSMRTSKPIQSSKEILDLEDDEDDEDKIPETYGLGEQWKEDLVWPSTGKNRVSVAWESLPKLRRREKLNDELINFYLRVLEIRMQETNPEAAKQVYWFNTFFYEGLTKSHTTFNYNAVKRTTRNVDLFAFDYVVVPIHEYEHWYVAIICNLPAINRKVPDFVEMPGSASNAATIDAENQIDLIPKDTAPVESKVDEGGTGFVDRDHDSASLFSINTKGDTALAHHASGVSTSQGLSDTVNNEPAAELMLAETPAADSASQLTDDSLIERGPAPSSEIMRKSKKSMDEIFDPILAHNDHDSVANISAIVEGDGDSTALETRLHGQKSVLPNAVTSLIPPDDDKSQPAISEADGVSLLPGSSQSSVARNQAPKSSVSKKGKKAPPVRRYNPQQPSIVTLDSFGTPHPVVANKLKKYLVAEARDKRGGMEIDSSEIQGCTGTGIPRQNNLSDCGVYVLGYMEKFVQNPKDLVTKLLQKTLDPREDWSLFSADLMRDMLRSLLLQMHDEQIGIRHDVKEPQVSAEPGGRQLNLLSTSDPDPPQTSKPQDDHELDTASLEMAPVPTEASVAPLTRADALANAQSLEDTAENETATASDPIKEQAQPEIHDVETDMREPFQYLDPDSDTFQRVRVRVQLPDFSIPSDTPKIYDMPVETSAADRTLNGDAITSDENQDGTPPRPKSRGKSLGPAKLPGKKLSRIKGKQNKKKDTEPIVLD